MPGDPWATLVLRDITLGNAATVVTHEIVYPDDRVPTASREYPFRRTKPGPPSLK